MNRMGVCLAGLVLLAGAGAWSVNRAESDWALRRIDVPTGLRLAMSHPITVAVVDTGISPTATGTGQPSLPIHPHGTAVADVVHSVDPWATLLDARVSDSQGQITLGRGHKRAALGGRIILIPIERFTKTLKAERTRVGKNTDSAYG